MVYDIEVRNREHIGMAYRADDPSKCIIAEYASNDWTYNFRDPMGWERPLLRITRTDHTIRIIVVEHKGPFHCDIYFNGMLVLDAVGGNEHRHIDDTVDFSIESRTTTLRQAYADKAVEVKPAEWIGPVNSLSDLNVGLISTQIGGPCGLAVYADELSEELSKLVSLKILNIPIWGINARDRTHYERLYREVVDAKLNVIHILQHAGTFHVYSDLSAFVQRLRSLGLKVVISATSAYSETVIADASHISRIADLTLLHTQREVDFFKNRMFGRAAVVRHGIKLCPDEPKEEAKKKNGVAGTPVIATHGMFAPTYKGVSDLVSATAILKGSYPDVRLLLVCAADRYPIQQVETELQVEHLGLQANVSFFPRFISTEEIYSLLHCADVIAFPYVGDFKDISGAFRKGLAARRPVIISDAPLFDPEFNLIRVPQKNPAKLAEAIKDLYENPEKAKGYVESVASQIEELSWKNISRQLAELYLSLWS